MDAVASDTGYVAFSLLSFDSFTLQRPAASVAAPNGSLSLLICLSASLCLLSATLLFTPPHFSVLLCSLISCLYRSLCYPPSSPPSIPEYPVGDSLAGPPGGELLPPASGVYSLPGDQLHEAGRRCDKAEDEKTEDPRNKTVADLIERESFGNSAIYSQSFTAPLTRSPKLTVSQHDGAEGRHHHRGAWCLW